MTRSPDPPGSPSAGLEDVLDHVREGFQIIGRDWRYRYVNEAVCRQGRRRKEDLLGRTMMEVYPGIEETGMFALLTRCMEEGTSGGMENEFTFPDGSKGWFELRVEPVPDGVLVLSLDISERKSLEAQLQQSQKTEALGRLAGGVAHDFNNILTVILNFGHFALQSFEPRDPARRNIDEVLEAARRAATLVRQLLAFSRRDAVSPRAVVVNELVANMDAMLRRIVGEHVELQTKLGKALWTVRIDPGALEQVLVNLAVNSRDAMSRGGKLTIETANAVLDEGYQMSKGGVVEPGDYVVIAVSDTGDGMDAETKRSIFEPFFTTKPPGRGTGLGLSTCYGIVKQAEGYIWVYSEPAKGTTFKIYLPRVRERAASLSAPQPEAPPMGTETILVVEDDPQVRSLVVHALESFGYRVIKAESAGDALRICEGASDDIDLVITDVVMPRMSGMDLAGKLLENRPELRVVFMSGYTEDAILHHGISGSGVNLIQKPFTLDILGRKVRSVLDAG